MYDMHYDLLTILYFNNTYNRFANREKLRNDLTKIYSHNILGGIINLYFMSEQEMHEELDISKEELQDVIAMFQKSIDFLKEYIRNGIIPKDVDFIFGIEGCDYIQDIEQLDKLYSLGLRSIIPVWNNPNIYGSGFRSKIGLTEKGALLIKKAIDLGMIIDVSHANEQTFYDILDVVKEEKKKGRTVHLIASHSNVKTLCNRLRNLTDEQLVALKECDGYIGLFTNSNFVHLNNKNMNLKERQKEFLNHLKYLLEVIKFDYRRIIIATDDMNFSPDESYHNSESYPIESIGKSLALDIAKEFGEEIANAVLVENAKQLIHQVK